jgi:hypothetical protein
MSGHDCYRSHDVEFLLAGKLYRSALVVPRGFPFFLFVFLFFSASQLTADRGRPQGDVGTR